MTKTEKVERTWLGRKGTSWEYRLGKGTSALGKRVVCVRWADDNSIEMKLVKGDGRTKDFVVYDEQTIIGTDERADRLAAYWLEPNA